MPSDIGFNFRSTHGYITPPEESSGTETYMVGTGDTNAGIYPITRSGATFGYETTCADRADRTTSVDRRLAGINYTTNDGSSQRIFRVDLPAAGLYRIHIALGDVTAQGYQYLEVRDNVSTLFGVTDATGTAGSEYIDATGIKRSAANWPSLEASVDANFASTILRVRFGSPTAQSGSTTLAHFRVHE